MSSTINSIPSLGLGNASFLKNKDYANFLQLTPEQQQSVGAKGLKFDDFGNSYGIDKAPEIAGETGMWDSIAGAFKPGEGGHSTAGNILKGASDAVGAIGGLGQLYFANKNYKLQKEQADYLKDREAKQDVRIGRFAANAGNGATY
jgi:hypothetical protein